MEYFAHSHSYFDWRRKKTAEKNNWSSLRISFVSPRFVYGYHFLLFYVNFLLNFVWLFGNLFPTKKQKWEQKVDLVANFFYHLCVRVLNGQGSINLAIDTKSKVRSFQFHSIEQRRASMTNDKIVMQTSLTRMYRCRIETWIEQTWLN